MKRIKFKSSREHEQAFVKAVRQRVQMYFRDQNIPMQGNRKMHIKTAFMLSLYVLPFIALLTIPMQPLIAILMVILVGVGEAGVGMSVMHDAAHGSYSRNKRTNRIFASTMFLLGSNTFNWKIQHNVMHHTFTNVYDMDPDISTKAVIRLCEHAPLRKYHRFQQFYAFPLYGLMTLSKLFGDLFTLEEYKKEGILEEQKVNPAKETFKLVLTKIIYFTIIFGLPLILTDYTFLQILLGFAIIHFTAGMIMSTVFQMAHVVEHTYQPLPDKENMIHDEWMVHEMKTTSDFGRRNGLLSWYIGGLDFQVEHHLFPHVCHVHYPAIAPIVENTAHEFGIRYNLNQSFGKALVSHFHRLKELGRLQHPPVD